MPYSRITGVGHYVPEQVVTNQDLEALMETSDAWIVERTGIRQRRFFTPGTHTVSGMAASASRLALQRAGVAASEVDFIIFATITPDYYFPGGGVMLQRELEMHGIGALDIRNQCSAFVYAVSIADQFIRSGMYRTILVAGSEIQSSLMDKTTEGRNLAVIFGDGAGAIVMQATEDKNRSVLSTHLHADGRYAEELIAKSPGPSRVGANNRWISPEMLENQDFEVFMNGNAVFKHAVQRFPEVINEALAANGLTKNDIDLLIPHQANLRITTYVREHLGLPEEKVVSNIDHYGNTTAASIPIAMSEAWEQDRLHAGDLVCLAAFGSGFTWASALLRW